ncbi:MAG: hypothetical protein IV100_32585 [Myxococcales bacterium]|nr:hypothetical protein [Myxococcales bacterium]
MKRPLILLAAAAALACESSSSSDGSADGADGTDGASATDAADGADGTDGSTSTDACAPPSGAEIVFPFTTVLAPEGSRGPAYGLATDGTDLFVNLFDRIVKAPLGGGTVSTIYQSSEEIPLGIAMWQDDDSLVVREAGKWYRLSFSGDKSDITVGLPNGSSVFNWDPSTDTFLAKLDSFESRTVDVVRVAVGSDTPETLINDSTAGYTRAWVKGGDYLYTQLPIDPVTADYTIQRFTGPSYGAAEPLALSPAPAGIAGATSEALYYFPDSIAAGDIGLYRVPHGSTTSERVYDQYWSVLAPGWGRADTSTLYVNDASALWMVPATGNAVKITTVPTGSCTTHEVMAHDGWIYTVTFKSLSEENQAWRIPLP